MFRKEDVLPILTIEVPRNVLTSSLVVRIGPFKAVVADGGIRDDFLEVPANCGVERRPDRRRGPAGVEVGAFTVISSTVPCKRVDLCRAETSRGEEQCSCEERNERHVGTIPKLREPRYRRGAVSNGFKYPKSTA